jgi:hypothetical protein
MKAEISEQISDVFAATKIQAMIWNRLAKRAAGIMTMEIYATLAPTRKPRRRKVPSAAVIPVLVDQIELPLQGRVGRERVALTRGYNARPGAWKLGARRNDWHLKDHIVVYTAVLHCSYTEMSNGWRGGVEKSNFWLVIQLNCRVIAQV